VFAGIPGEATSFASPLDCLRFVAATQGARGVIFSAVSDFAARAILTSPSAAALS